VPPHKYPPKTTPPAVPKNLDPAVASLPASQRFAQLHDEDFPALFDMSKSQFDSLPKWKQNSVRKEKNLF
jgi:hypothetical protein